MVKSDRNVPINDTEPIQRNLQNPGFAIAIEDAKPIIDILMKKEEIR